MRWKMAVLVAVLASVAVMPGTTGCEVATGEDIIAHVSWVCEVLVNYGSGLERVPGIPVFFDYYRETGGVIAGSTRVTLHRGTGEDGKVFVTQNERIGPGDVLTCTCTVTPPGNGATITKTQLVTHAEAAAAVQDPPDAYLSYPMLFLVDLSVDEE